MPLQNFQRLAMFGLGVTGDMPPAHPQPPLVDGIHLRWVFERELGFPSHGFYLFRRPSISPNLNWPRYVLQQDIGQLPVGPLGGSELDTSLGRLSSDTALRLVDDFKWDDGRFSETPSAYGAALDLRDRQYLRLSFGDLAELLAADELGPRWIKLTIGFYENFGTSGERVSFARRVRDWPEGQDLEVGANPREEQGVVFRHIDAAGALQPVSLIASLGGPLRISYLSSGSSWTGFGWVIAEGICEIILPLTCRIVWLLVSGGTTVEAFNEDGSSQGRVTVGRVEEGFFEHEVGRGVRRIHFNGALYRLAFAGAETEGGVTVTGLVGDTIVAQERIRGVGGHIQHRWMQFETLTSIEIGPAPAALIDLWSYRPGYRAAVGWQKVPNFPYPLSLPVTHPDYPASGGAPVNLAAAETLALSRIAYGRPEAWAGQPFADLHAQLVTLVEGGSSPPMSERFSTRQGIPASSPAPAHSVALRQYPLDLMLLTALHPAMAQMLGLYWVDRPAVPDDIYDYLLLATWSNDPALSSRDPEAVLAKLQRDGITADMDAYIAVEVSLSSPPPLATPKNTHVYALPGGTMRAREGGVEKAANIAGVVWDLGKSVSGTLLPDQAIIYHVWRADLGNVEPTAPPADGAYGCITQDRPVLVANPVSGQPRAEHQNPSWPPFRLHYLDRGLADGWYSYQVSGIDIFGRHSPRSSSSSWHPWAPVPKPRPWYYQNPPGDQEINPFAVKLVERILPPPPTAVDAWALDPRDPTMLRDAAYNAWYATLSPAEQKSLVGLRLRWLWTEAHMRQAPDTREFRIYFQQGPPNILSGTVRSVEGEDPTEVFVETDIAATGPNDNYAGLRLHVGDHAFQILGNSDDPVWFHLRTDDPTVWPQRNAACWVVIELGHPLYGAPTTWRERHYVVGFEEHVTPGTDADGHPVRRYEVFLPAAGDVVRDDLPLTPSLAEPVVYAHVAASAADGKPDVPDAAKWSTGRWGNRPGNEGPVGPAIKIFRVLRERPDPPVPAPDAERVFATRADYHSRSYYTYR